MPLTIPESLREAMRARLTRRGVAALLALSIETLIVLLFLTISSGFLTKPKPRPKIFQMEKEREKEKKAAPPIEIAKEESKRRNGGGSRPSPSPSEIIAPTPPTPPLPNNPSTVLWLSHDAYRSSDIAGKQGDVKGPGQGRGTSADPDSALANGKGPHGEPVYVAEWYREPTNAELNPYIPERARGRSGWGVIVCRTAPNYRVEDCQEVDDSPRGSGYAGAVRQAAFQFKVRPPRVGHKPMIGALVWIRVVYSITVVPAHGDTARPGPQSDDDSAGN